MSKFKGGRSKAVEDGWVDHVTVLVTVSVTEGKDFWLVRIVRSHNYWQPLVIHDVQGKGNPMTQNLSYSSTCICDKYFPGLLVEFLVGPVSVEVFQLHCKSVVLPQQDSLVGRGPIRPSKKPLGCPASSSSLPYTLLASWKCVIWFTCSP